jgi:hypothetical protein
MALGANPMDVVRLILRNEVRLAELGIAIGVVAALALTCLMVNMLYDASRTDPLTYLAISALLLPVALPACYVPECGAMRVELYATTKNLR